MVLVNSVPIQTCKAKLVRNEITEIIYIYLSCQFICVVCIGVWDYLQNVNGWKKVWKIQYEQSWSRNMFVSGYLVLDIFNTWVAPLRYNTYKRTHLTLRTPYIFQTNGRVALFKIRIHQSWYFEQYMLNDRCYNKHINMCDHLKRICAYVFRFHA